VGVCNTSRTDEFGVKLTPATAIRSPGSGCVVLTEIEGQILGGYAVAAPTGTNNAAPKIATASARTARSFIGRTSFSSTNTPS
jgi:hypothetical protein